MKHLKKKILKKRDEELDQLIQINIHLGQQDAKKGEKEAAGAKRRAL